MSKPLLTIKEQWEMYVASIYPTPISQVQYDETQKAFYAAFASIMEILEYIGEEEIPEETGVDILDNIFTEAEVFAKSLHKHSPKLDS